MPGTFLGESCQHPVTRCGEPRVPCGERALSWSDSEIHEDHPRAGEDVKQHGCHSRWECGPPQPLEETSGWLLAKLSARSRYDPALGVDAKELRTLFTQTSAHGCLQRLETLSPPLGSSQDVLQGMDKQTGVSRQWNAAPPRPEMRMF